MDGNKGNRDSSGDEALPQQMIQKPMILIERIDWEKSTDTDSTTDTVVFRNIHVTHFIGLDRAEIRDYPLQASDPQPSPIEKEESGNEEVDGTSRAETTSTCPGKLGFFIHYYYYYYFGITGWCVSLHFIFSSNLNF